MRSLYVASDVAVLEPAMIKRNSLGMDLSLYKSEYGLEVLVEVVDRPGLAMRTVGEVHCVDQVSAT